MLTKGTMPQAIASKLREAARLWAVSDARPRVAPHIKAKWDALIAAWADSDLPLPIRKSGSVRGAAISHSTGRNIIFADNSPAQWAFSRAVCGQAYTLKEIGEFIRRDTIPFAYATKRAEKELMYLKCTLTAADNVNKAGWKLCHIEEIGLSTRTPVQELPLATLVRHFSLLMKPSNHFVVPLEWAGFGELPEVIDELRRAECTV